MQCDALIEYASLTPALMHSAMQCGRKGGALSRIGWGWGLACLMRSRRDGVRSCAHALRWGWRSCARVRALPCPLGLVPRARGAQQPCARHKKTPVRCRTGVCVTSYDYAGGQGAAARSVQQRHATCPRAAASRLLLCQVQSVTVATRESWRLFCQGVV
jgi:hypothetical protein